MYFKQKLVCCELVFHYFVQLNSVKYNALTKTSTDYSSDLQVTVTA